MTSWADEYGHLTAQEVIKLNEQENTLKDENDREYERAVRAFGRLFNAFLVALAMLALTVISLVIGAITE